VGPASQQATAALGWLRQQITFRDDDRSAVREPSNRDHRHHAVVVAQRLPDRFAVGRPSHPRRAVDAPADVPERPGAAFVTPLIRNFSAAGAEPGQPISYGTSPG
jgi:hypothetical protein